MDRKIKILTMDQFLKDERKKYCPFMVCKDSCPLKGLTCSIDTGLRDKHQTHLKYYDPAFQVRW